MESDLHNLLQESLPQGQSAGVIDLLQIVLQVLVLSFDTSCYCLCIHTKNKHTVLRIEQDINCLYDLNRLWWCAPIEVVYEDDQGPFSFLSDSFNNQPEVFLKLCQKAYPLLII